MRPYSEEPPQPQPQQLITSLPNDVVLNCLARVSTWDHPSLYFTCKSFRSLVVSGDLDSMRSSLGLSEPRLYARLQFPPKYGYNHHWFALRRKRLVPFPCFSSHQPSLRSSVVTVGSELYFFGGYEDPEDGPLEYFSRVSAFHCRSHTWRHLPSMRMGREGCVACFLDGKIYVFGGGHRKGDIAEATHWGEVFTLKSQTWEALPSPDSNIRELGTQLLTRDSVVMDGKIHAFSRSGGFFYEPKEGRWGVTTGCPLNFRAETSNFCVVDNTLYTCDDQRSLVWYDRKESVWRLVKGVEVLHYFSFIATLANNDGKLAFCWKRRGLSQPNSTTDFRYAEVSLQKRGQTEIWGTVELFDLVFTAYHAVGGTKVIDLV